MGVDMTKNFFFSYSYSLAHTLQHNHTATATATAMSQQHPTPAAASATASHCGATATGDAAGSVYDSMFVWNAFLTRALRATMGSGRWTLPLVHGYWEQRQVRGDRGHEGLLTIIAINNKGSVDCCWSELLAVQHLLQALPLSKSLPYIIGTPCHCLPWQVAFAFVHSYHKGSAPCHDNKK